MIFVVLVGGVVVGFVKLVVIEVLLVKWPSWSLDVEYSGLVVGVLVDYFGWKVCLDAGYFGLGEG